jgi:hypothetical protein
VSFNPNIPLVGDFLAISQKQILANYQAIANAYLINHVPLNADENVGMHDCLTLRPQASDPTTALGQVALYNKLVSNVPQLFYRPSVNQTPIQMSNSNLNTLQTGALSDAQSSFLAGPFTIYFGFFANCPPNQLITLLPASTLIYVGLSTVKTNTNFPSARQGNYIATPINITANQFTITHAAVSLVNPIIYYMAIGI